MTKNFISLWDFSSSEIEEMLNLAAKVKKNSSSYKNELKNKNIALIFSKPSTRTRTSFEVGINQLGGHALYMNAGTTQLGKGETIGDTSKVMSRYVDAIVARLYDHKDILEMARFSSVPVINALTNLLHPCQILSDLFTIKEKFKKTQGINLTYMGNAYNNIAHSLIIGSKKAGINLTISCPKGMEPDKSIMKRGNACIVYDPRKAAKDADILYTDKWFSMHEKEDKNKLAKLRRYQINNKVLGSAWAMHDLPAHRNWEITSSVMDSPHSLIWDQAENRLHAQKAMMIKLIK